MFDFFSGGGNSGAKATSGELPQQQQQQGGQPSSDPQQQNSSVDMSTGNLPNGSGEETSQNPLDAFKDLYNNPSNGEKGQTAPSFSLDQERLSQAASSVDFLHGLPEDLQQRVANGDANAMMELVSHAAKNAYTTALQHSGALTDKFVNAYTEYNNSTVLPDYVNTAQRDTALSSIDDATLKHPAIFPLLKDTAKRIAQQNPDLPPNEVAEQARQYVSSIAEAFGQSQSNQSESSGNRQAAGDVDWESFFK